MYGYERFAYISGERYLCNSVLDRICEQLAQRIFFRIYPLCVGVVSVGAGVIRVELLPEGSLRRVPVILIVIFPQSIEKLLLSRVHFFFAWEARINYLVACIIAPGIADIGIDVPWVILKCHWQKRE